jgi:hypothetical protein
MSDFFDFNDSEMPFSFDQPSSDPVINNAMAKIYHNSSFEEFAAFDNDFFGNDPIFDNLAADMAFLPSSRTDGEMILPATSTPPPPMGPIETLWSSPTLPVHPSGVPEMSDFDLPVPIWRELGYPPDFIFPTTTPSPAAIPSPPVVIVAKKKAAPKPRAPRKPAAPKVKAAKVSKTKAKTTTTVPAVRERTLQELYNVQFMSLTSAEKAMVLLPLLQGVDPNTGLKMGVAGTMSAPADYEAVGGKFGLAMEYGATRQAEALAKGLRR